MQLAWRTNVYVRLRGLRVCVCVGHCLFRCLRGVLGLCWFCIFALCSAGFHDGAFCSAVRKRFTVAIPRCGAESARPRHQTSANTAPCIATQTHSCTRPRKATPNHPTTNRTCASQRSNTMPYETHHNRAPQPRALFNPAQPSPAQANQTQPNQLQHDPFRT